MNQTTVSDHDVFVQHGRRQNGDMLANATAGHDMNARMQRRTSPNHHIVAHDRMGMHIDIFTQLGRWRNDCQGANPHPLASPRRMKEIHNTGESDMYVWHFDRRQLQAQGSAWHDGCRSGRANQSANFIGPIDQRNLAGLSRFEQSQPHESAASRRRAFRPRSIRPDRPAWSPCLGILSAS